MAGERMGLYDLVAAARERHLGLRQVRKWFIAYVGTSEGVEVVEGVANDIADAALEAAWQGQYTSACKIASSSDGVVNRAAHYADLYEVSIELQCPPWEAFQDVCELAERIDSFLAAMSRDKVAVALVADCRQDIRLLLVLADWCAEHDLPAAAAEARHLYRLTR